MLGIRAYSIDNNLITFGWYELIGTLGTARFYEEN